MVLKNKRGQVIFFTLMLSVVVVLLAMALIPVVNEFATGAMNGTSDTAVGLDCGNSSISDYTKGQCVLTDAATPYFFFGFIGIALLIIGAKLIIQ
jgi:hypothetical protein